MWLNTVKHISKENWGNTPYFFCVLLSSWKSNEPVLPLYDMFFITVLQHLSMHMCIWNVQCFSKWGKRNGHGKMPLTIDLFKTSNSHIFFIFIYLFCLLKNKWSPDWCGSFVWVLPYEPKSCWLDSWSGHMPGL